MIDALDNQGLICGFILRSQHPATPVTWGNLAEALKATDGTVWVHFNLVDRRAWKWITECDLIPPAAHDRFSIKDSHIHLDRLDQSLVGALADFHYDFKADPEELGVFWIYLHERYVITGRRYPLKATDCLRRDILNGLPIDSSCDIFIRLLQLLVNMFHSVIADLTEAIDTLEDLILKGRFYRKSESLSRIRRLLARLHRHLNGERHTLLKLQENLPSWFKQTDQLRVQQMIDSLNAIAQDIESLQERARLMREEISSRLEEATNRNLYVLSIVATIFLPGTLITGMFGMNVGGLPWLEDPLGFGRVTFIMAVTAAIALLILQRRRFF